MIVVTIVIVTQKMSILSAMKSETFWKLRIHRTRGRLECPEGTDHHNTPGGRQVR